MLGNEDFLADGVLKVAVGTAGEFLGGVGNGMRGREGFGILVGSADCVGLSLTEFVETPDRSRMLLPRQVFSLEVFVEFRFFVFEKGQVAEGGVGDFASVRVVGLAVADKVPAEVEDFLNRAESTLACDEEGLSRFIRAKNNRMHQPPFLNGGDQFLHGLRVEFLALAVFRNLNVVDGDCAHKEILIKTPEEGKACSGRNWSRA